MRVLAFEPRLYGHHPAHVGFLVEHWTRHRLRGSLGVAVSPEFINAHPDVVALAHSYPGGGVEFVPLHFPGDYPNDLNATSTRASLRTARTHWRVAREIAAKYRPEHCLLMYLDPLHVPIALDALRGRPFPVPFSGVCFQPPSLHYKSLGMSHPTLSESAKQVGKRLLLGIVTRQEEFMTAFCLDPIAVPHLRIRFPHVNWEPLPDPVRITEPVRSAREPFRSRLNVEPGRRLFLLFGVISRRKGALHILDAIHLLPKETSATTAVAFVGKVADNVREEFGVRVERARRRTAAQIIVCDGWVPDPDVRGYFEASDFVLMPYQRKVGMSGVLVLAAAVGRPVLASNFGLIGHLVRNGQLGTTFDSGRTSELATVMEWVMTRPPESFCDAEAMRRFALENSSDAFAATLVDVLLGGKPT